ncbi:hypothetical protein TCAL_17053 [Tigriopus californicus]|uniref:Ionotropic glutamate receptor L-glutamate and glycine-binding domain-containing protein n=1 Tax=Tigriopus californicus TaxID=6832 RepID=A0A553PQ24_TIGCA|nr:hypothetical protein TCAL_17053 [Tigriopus californicus]
MEGPPIKINLKNKDGVQPFMCTSVHSIPHGYQDMAKAELDYMESMGIAEDSADEPSPWHVHNFCGRLELSYWLFNENHWTTEVGFTLPFGFRGEACAHLLFNQTFKVAQYGLLPNVFPDKSDSSVTGTDVEALKLLAEKYKMHLEFHFGKADTAATTADPNATHPLAKEYQGKFQGVVPGLQFYNNRKLMTLLWSVFALLVVSFYTSNLRTNLIAPNLEPEINSHEDVLKYDMTVHADHLLSFLLQLTVSPAFDEILRRMKDQDKWYHPIESQLLEAHVKKAVLEDGEVYLATAENILYSYLLQDTLGFPHLRISDDSLVNFYMCLRLTKFSPYTPDINKLFIINHEFGLHKSPIAVERDHVKLEVSQR